MKTFFLFCVLPLALLACQGQPKKAGTSVPQVKRSHASSVVSFSASKTPLGADSSLAGEDPGPNLDTVYRQYIRLYHEPLSVDSLFLVDGDSYHLLFRHYCLLDSAIILTGPWLASYHLHRFVTHNFESTLQLTKNGRLLYRKTIHKGDFTSLLYPEERRDGVLLYPNLTLLHDTVEVQYSISIPLTDVGLGVVMGIGPDGTVLCTRH